jgi:predicted nucleotidyltransferase
MFPSLAERKEATTTARRAAAHAVCDRLSEYARSHGGRFIVYGSVAKDQIRADSDVDILVDFPPDREADAWRFAELKCGEVGLPFDIKPMAWCKDAFLARIGPTMRVLR